VHYGLGSMSVGGMLGHDGAVPGYTADMFYLPSKKATVIVLLNDNVVPVGTNPGYDVADGATVSIAQIVLSSAGAAPGPGRGELAALLHRHYGYEVARQTGSHPPAPLRLGAGVPPISRPYRLPIWLAGPMTTTGDCLGSSQRRNRSRSPSGMDTQPAVAPPMSACIKMPEPA